MPRIPEQDKMRSKEQMLMLLKRYHGLREAEISALLNIHRRTVNNYLNELEHEAKVYKDGLNWHAEENSGNWLRRFELTADEAFTLYLATRQFVKQTDKQNAMALSALSRLSEVLKTELPVRDDIFRAAQELRKRKKEADYEDIFSKVVKAYLLRHPVRLVYRTAQDQSVETDFHTYLIEPSAIGHTLYLIGYSTHVNELRSYKIERILTAVPDYNQTYTIPDDFPGLDILQTAWSIMIGETTKRVLLRFSPRVKNRVLETNWHPSQGYEPDPDKPNHLRWWVDVANITDIKPWVRSWGSDVEVLEPAELRESIKSHVKNLANVYTIGSATAVSLTDRLLLLWGKTSKDDDLFHPALYHMFDVAHIAQQLLSPLATPRWRQVLGQILGTSPDLLYQWLPLLVALHDIGKLTWPFQMLNTSQKDRLTAQKFDFGNAITPKLHHTNVGRIILESYTASWPPNLSEAFLSMVNGHHGGSYRYETSDPKKFQMIQEPPEWDALRQHAIQLLTSYLCQQWPDPLPNPANVSAAIVALNGFCILCDWLGSDGNYFSPKPNTPLPEYVSYSRQKAYERVKDAGLFQTAVSHAPTSFTELFHDLEVLPRPLQTAVEQIPHALLAHPTLTIIEAPTGEGKTEAALLLARRIAAQRGTDEMYIALPTTATSNAMYTRIITHIKQRLDLKTNVQLVHGQSFLLEDDLLINPLINGENTAEDVAAQNWFAPKKKALLAPFGVGTIDQAELAALNVRHNALRLMGLAGKTIILDEVHAYDTYMTTIIKRMLNWLAALGSSVILLSATLPKAKRSELMTAFEPKVDTTAVNLDTYPNILVIGNNTVYAPAEPIAVFQPDKQIHLDTLSLTDEQAREKAEWLLAQVENGGCVCWITNTVNRAQAIFQALQSPADIDVILLHGRFPLAQRQTIEADILQKYGKPNQSGHRPHRGIVIGTQVLEQSLDLDFDLMVTDLAPIDLILQRAGRLHRHQRDLSIRHRHTTPRLVINAIRDQADQAIYSDYILQMTERALQNLSSFTLPADYRLLIETVYTDVNAGKTDKTDKAVTDARKAFDDTIFKLEVEANTRLIAKPIADCAFYKAGDGSLKFSEDEDSIAWSVAQTRWAERETITVIPLVQNLHSVQVAGNAQEETISLNTQASRAQQLYLLRHSLRVSHPKLVSAIKSINSKSKYPLFMSALLKNAYPLWLTPISEETAVYVNNELEQPVYLHPQLGLVFGHYEEK